MRFREQRRGRNPEPDATADAGPGDASPEVDVQALVDRFMIDPDAAVATRQWTPSRRGNSPHHGS